MPDSAIPTGELSLLGPTIDLDQLADLATPAYVCDLGALQRNLDILQKVQRQGGCKILLALKGFAMWSVFPQIREVLQGISASSPHEARLGREQFDKEVHAYAPAYSSADVDELIQLADHIVFNSPKQYFRYCDRIRSGEETVPIQIGLRINPQHSEVEVALYDPCAPYSRLGTTIEQLRKEFPGGLHGLDGLHFHNLCELGADSLARTLDRVESDFSEYLSQIRWINMGGGHHITRPDYDVDGLIELVVNFRKRHGVEVYLEPGEAIALNTGILWASVLDILDNGMKLAILDTSATAHMPDVLEMPYRPTIVGAGASGQYAHTYRLGGLTCLAGDVIGDYSFERPLKIGDKLAFLDMAHYTMVKNTTFNGVRLPSIVHYDPGTQTWKVVREFGYTDYKNRLS